VKIVDVSEFYSETGGGVRIYTHQKLKLAARLGHALTIIAPGAEDKIEACHGGTIRWVKSPPLPVDRSYHMFWRARDVWRALDEEAPDIVEGASPWRGGWLAGHWPGSAPRVFVFHQDFVAGLPNLLLGDMFSRARIDRMFGAYWRYLRKLSSRFDATVTSAPWLADRLETFGIHRPIAVPFGVEPGIFSPGRRDENLRRELLARCGMPADARLLLAVGRMHPEKRYNTIIDAYARAKSQCPLGLVIVGDGVIRSAVERRACQVGNVHFTGAIHDRNLLAAHYASADVFVHGSGAETYGLAIAEAISSGLRVVAPDRGGAVDFAAGDGVEIYKTGDATSCAGSILAALNAKLGNSRKFEIRSLDDHFASLFALYEELAAAKPAAVAATQA